MFRRHRERGGESPPFFFFFLDRIPRWENGFPSGPWSPWQGRGESRSEIGSVSLSLSVSAFPDSSLSPFLIFPEIRNSDWIETFATIFFPKISFLAAKEEQQPPYGVPTRVRGVIRPFCIMLLYRYVLHCGLILHIISQYLWQFSLILQGLP